MGHLDPTFIFRIYFRDEVYLILDLLMLSLLHVQQLTLKEGQLTLLVDHIIIYSATLRYLTIYLSVTQKSDNSSTQ